MGKVSEDDIKKAVNAIAQQGQQPFIELMLGEPNAATLIKNSVDTCLTSIFGDAIPSSTHDVVIYHRAVANIQSLAATMFLLTRQLYRDYSVELLEKQLAMENTSGSIGNSSDRTAEGTENGKTSTNAGPTDNSGGDGKERNEDKPV